MGSIGILLHIYKIRIEVMCDSFSYLLSHAPKDESTNNTQC